MAGSMCVVSSHPWVKKTAEKYNISKYEAQIVINNATAKDPNLYNVDVDRFDDYVVNNQAFKDALDEVKGSYRPARNPNEREVKDLIEECRSELGIELTETQAYNFRKILSDILRMENNSHVSSVKIRKLMHTFKNAGRMEFIGNWVTRKISSILTRIEHDPAYRKRNSIRKRTSRRLYLTDSDTYAFIMGEVRKNLGDAIDGLKANGGDAVLQEELNATMKNLQMMTYIFGSRLFREEGVKPSFVSSSVEGTDVGPGTYDRNASVSDQRTSSDSKLHDDIRRLLSSLVERDAEGNPIADRYGYGLEVYADPSEVKNVLHDLLHECDSMKDVIKIMRDKESSFTWMSDLLDALDKGRRKTNRSRSERLSSMFYRFAMMEFTPMIRSYTYFDGLGRLVQRMKKSNMNDAIEKLRSTLYRNFRKHTRADIFSQGKTDFKKVEKIYNNARDLSNKTDDQWDKVYAFRSGIKAANAEVDKLKKEVMNLLKSIGIRVNARDLGLYLDLYRSTFYTKDILNVNNAKQAMAIQRLENLHILCEDISIIATAMMEMKAECDNANSSIDDYEREGFRLDNGGRRYDAATDQFFGYRKPRMLVSTDGKRAEQAYEEYELKRRYVYYAYENLINRIGRYAKSNIESMSYSAGKAFYSWNNPSTVGLMLKHLTDEDISKVRDYIMKKFGQDAFFRTNNSTEDNPVFISDWINMLYKDTEGFMREMLQWYQKTDFNGHDYEMMTSLEYLTTMISDYFTTEELQSEKPNALYRMPIASDKPKYIVIRAPRYSEISVDENGNWRDDDYHRIIEKKALDFFAQELWRAIDVAKNALDGGGVSIDNYDIRVDDTLREKMRKGTVTVNDVLDKKGKYRFANSGASFYFNKFLIREIENKTELGKYIIDRIFNSIKHSGKQLVEPRMYDAFNKAFHSYMAEMADDVMKRLDECGGLNPKRRRRMVTDEYGNIEEENGYEYGLLYFDGQMETWREQNNYHKLPLRSDKERIDNGAAIAERIGMGTPQKDDRRYAAYLTQLSKLRDYMEEYVYNNWLATVNMMQIFNADPAFYGNTVTYQKRNAQTVSSGYPIDPDATIHGRPVSDGRYRSITVKTPGVSVSAEAKNIEVLINNVIKGISDPLQKAALEKAMENILDALKNFDSTDGQAYTSLTGLRKKLAGMGMWSRSDNEETDDDGYVMDGDNVIPIYTDEAVYRRLKRGHKGVHDKECLVGDMLHVFTEAPLKGFMSGFATVERNGRKITVPVQHKNSEYALTMMSAFLSETDPDSQLAAIARFMEESAEKSPEKGIDTVNFDSAVKVGNNDEMIDISGLDGPQTLETLREAVYSSEDARQALPENYTNGVVTEYDMEDYRIVQEKKEHFRRSSQPMGTQMKVLAIANIGDATECTLPDGTKISGRQLKARYLDALARKTARALEAFRNEFGLNSSFPNSRLHALSLKLKRMMADNVRSTPDMREAMSVERRLDGSEALVAPLDDPAMQSSIESSLLKRIRDIFYRQKTNGGIVVQASSWGKRDNLHIKFYSTNEQDKDSKTGEMIMPTYEEFVQREGLGSLSDNEKRKRYDEYVEKYQGGYAYFECEIPMQDKVRRMLIDRETGQVGKEYLNADGTWNMEKVREKVPASVFDAICYRVPTEAKYSMMVCRVKGFTTDNAAFYPEELTVFTGSNFDIDTDSIVLRPLKDDENADIDNEIFDLQVAALRSSDAVGETFRSGDFTDLSELSYEVVLLMNGYTKEDLKNMDFKAKKKACMAAEDMDLTNPVTASVLFDQNSQAKKMIGIAAVGVTSHAFMTLYNSVTQSDDSLRNPAIHPENFVRLRVPGKNSAFTVVIENKDGKETSRTFTGDVPIDLVHDMEGNVISSEISKYVGSSADAAKDAAMNRLNITPVTLPVLVLMHRLGIPSNIARMFIAQPVIRKVVDEMVSGGNMAYTRLGVDMACNKVMRDLLSNRILKDYHILPNTKAFDDKFEELKEKASVNPTLRLSDLIDKMTAGIEGDNDVESQFALITLYMKLNRMAQTLRNLDGFTRYNSSNAMRKGTSLIRRMMNKQRIDKLALNLEVSKTPPFSLPQDVKIDPKYGNGEMARLCTMFPYIADTIIGEEEMLCKVMLDNMRTYSPAFFKIAEDMMEAFDNETDDMVTQELESMYNSMKSWILFCSRFRIADFSDPAVFAKYTYGFTEYYRKKLEEIKRKTPKVYDKYINDSLFIDSLSEKETDGIGSKRFEVLTANVAGISGESLDKFKGEWEAMLENEKTRQLAIDIAIHFLARSPGFMRDSAAHLIPLKVRKAIPGYMEAFERADRLEWTNNDIDMFKEVFQRNTGIMPVANFRDNPGSLYDSKTRKLTLPKNVAGQLSGNLDNEGLHVSYRLPVISIFSYTYGEAMYRLKGHGAVDGNGNVIFDAVPVTQLGVPNFIGEYRTTELTDSVFAKTGQGSDEMTGYVPAETSNENRMKLIFNGGADMSGTFITGETDSVTATDNTDAGEAIGSSDKDLLKQRGIVRRSRSIATAFGVRIDTVSSRVSDDRKTTELTMDVTSLPSMSQEGAFSTPHDKAVMVAAVAGTLAFKNGKTTVRTYTDGSHFTHVEYVIKVNDVNATDEILEALPGAVIDRRTGSVRITAGRDDMDTTKRMVYKGFIELRKKSIVDEDARITENFMQVTEIDDTNRKEILEKAKRYGEQTKRDNKGGIHSERAGIRERNGTRLEDYIRLAIDRQNGKDTSYEEEKIFGKEITPTTETAGRKSESLMDFALTAVAGVNTSSESDILNSSRRRMTMDEKMKMTIEDLAKMISEKDNRGEILGILSKSNSSNIIRQINEILKEKDIC